LLFLIFKIIKFIILKDLRKRFKYLSHLPLSCDVTFLEVDLKGFVSDKSLKIFESMWYLFVFYLQLYLYLLNSITKDELKQRYNRRKEKARKEEWLHVQAVNKERRSKDIQQESLSSDPFFQPYSYGEASNSNSGAIIPEPSNVTESVRVIDNNKNQYDGPKTVWGTPVVSFANVTKEKDSISIEHDHEEEVWNYPEEIFVGKKQKKKKLVLMSTGGKRQR
jgi:hypothetical protein